MLALGRPDAAINAARFRIGRCQLACRRAFIASNGRPLSTYDCWPTHSRAVRRTRPGSVGASTERFGNLAHRFVRPFLPPACTAILVNRRSGNRRKSRRPSTARVAAVRSAWDRESRANAGSPASDRDSARPTRTAVRRKNYRGGHSRGRRSAASRRLTMHHTGRAPSAAHSSRRGSAAHSM